MEIFIIIIKLFLLYYLIIFTLTRAIRYFAQLCIPVLRGGI